MTAARDCLECGAIFQPLHSRHRACSAHCQGKRHERLKVERGYYRTERAREKRAKYRERNRDKINRQAAEYRARERDAIRKRQRKRSRHMHVMVKAAVALGYVQKISKKDWSAEKHARHAAMMEYPLSRQWLPKHSDLYQQRREYRQNNIDPVLRNESHKRIRLQYTALKALGLI